MQEAIHAPTTETRSAERPMRQSVLRGLRLKCPACGTGPLMRGYLKTRDSCAVCGEELHHHRADDGPAHMTVLVTGHIMAPLILYVFATYRPDPLVLAVLFGTGFSVLALFLLPRFKGMFVAVQWAKRMHGFGAAP